MSEEETKEPQQGSEGSQENAEETSQPGPGAWGEIETGELNPKLSFEMNKEYDITFPDDFQGPKERPNKDNNGGVFYIFDVKYNGEDRAIITSAWSLLRGLKMNEPLAGKTLRVKKSMKEGKQNYEVQEVNQGVPVEKPGEPKEQTM